MWSGVVFGKSNFRKFQKACKDNQMFLIKKKKAQWFSDTYILLNLF